MPATAEGASPLAILNWEEKSQARRESPRA
jgi:hypothetical protein